MWVVTLINMFIVCCPYCNSLTDNGTHEHLVPRSYGGVGVIVVCEDCNSDRKNSFTYPNFVNFIRDNPELYRMHVEASNNDDNKKNILLQALVENNEDLIETWYALGLTETQRQKEALERARAGEPISGGRADRALSKAIRHKQKKKKRHFLKNYCRVRF